MSVPDSPTPVRNCADVAPLVQRSPPVQSKKRKHEDVIKTLDRAISTTAEDLGDIRPAKKQHTTRSIYSTLVKYGIAGKDSEAKKKVSDPKPDITTKAPHLSAILAKTAAKTRKAMPFKLPFSASSASLASSPSIKDFSPSSTQAFLERLGTFKPSTYTSKPEPIDSAAAARCGWINEGKDRLLCTICSASWVVAGRDGMTRDAAIALVEKQRGQLVSQHKNLCPWKDRQCDPSIYTVQMKAPAVMARELKGRSIALEPVLKDVKIQHPLTSSHIATVRAILESISLKPPPVPPFPLSNAAPASLSSSTDVAMSEPSETAVVAGLFGWSPAPPNQPSERLHHLSAMSIRGSSRAPSVTSLPNTRESTPTPGPSTPIRRPSFTPSHTSLASPGSATESAKKAENLMLHCTLCQRRVGMWTFIPATPDPTTSDSAEGSPAPSPARPMRPRPNRAFDVLKEHRPYCPYVVRTTALPSLPVTPGIAESSTLARKSNVSVTDSDKVEGWRAVLSSICRYGLGQRRSGSAMSGATDSTVQSEEMDEVEAMVDRVKARGGKELFKYVKGLLG